MADKEKSKNDLAWETLFKQLNILESIKQHGIFEISAAQITPVRESRLMAKFDQEKALPDIFRDNHLSILPLSRSRYTIGHFKTFYHLPKDEEKLDYISIPFPSSIESIDYRNLYSEAAALACAYHAGIIHDLVEEATRWTIMGRMTTDDFSFQIDHTVNPRERYSLAISHAQCEIDAGFESDSTFALVEAKNIAVESIMIRQMYYPFRLWQSRLPNKTIVPMLMVYSDDMFSFYTFAFETSDYYNSLSLQDVRRYKIAPEEIHAEDIAQLFATISLIDEPTITLPQADSFENVIDLINLLHQRDLSRDEITEYFSFADRQTNYYTDAARYLDLVDKYTNVETNEVCFTLTQRAKALWQKRHKAKYLGLMRLILERKIFYDAFIQMQQSGTIPSIDAVSGIIVANNVPLSGSTIPRRARTIRGWIQWIWKQIVD